MKLSFDSVSRHTGLVSVALLCGITAVSCSKKQEASSDENQVVVAENENAADTAPAIQCNDPIALTQLTQSVKASVGSQTQALFNSYAERANASLSYSNANNAVGSILIDVANPTMLQGANANGMVTCNASLSLTVPNKDVIRANKAYQRLEGDGDLGSYLQSQNITLNNNMLVSNNFNYVVGMQGGQSAARVVGQPAILTAASDIIARSQFQSALDASRAGPATVKPRSEPALPSEPTLRQEPRVRPEPEQRQHTPAQQHSEPQPEPNPRAEAPAPINTPKRNTDNNDNEVVGLNTPSKPAKPQEPKEPMKVPEDERIEMVIIEEEGTY